MASESLERDEYDRRWSDSGRYSAEHFGYTPYLLRFMDQWLPSGGARPIRVLELGCGDGYFSSELGQRGCDVTGVDISEVAIQIARDRYPSGQFLEHDLSKPLPFMNGSFDAVWCSEVLEHLFSPLFVLREITRVMDDNGRLLSTVPYHGFIKNIGIALFAFEKHYRPTCPHIRFFTKRSLAELVEYAGLHVVEIDTCGSRLGVRDWVCPTNILLVAEKRC